MLIEALMIALTLTIAISIGAAIQRQADLRKKRNLYDLRRQGRLEAIGWLGQDPSPKGES